MAGTDTAPTSPSPAPTTDTGMSKTEYNLTNVSMENVVKKVYEKYNPDVSSHDSILEKYKGKENDFVNLLQYKYKIETSEMESIVDSCRVVEDVPEVVEEKETIVEYILSVFSKSSSADNLADEVFVSTFDSTPFELTGVNVTEVVYHFYETHNSDKAMKAKEHASLSVKTYEGDESTMLQHLCHKYSVSRDEMQEIITKFGSCSCCKPKPKSVFKVSESHESEGNAPAEISMSEQAEPVEQSSNEVEEQEEEIPDNKLEYEKTIKKVVPQWSFFGSDAAVAAEDDDKSAFEDRP